MTAMSLFKAIGPAAAGIMYATSSTSFFTLLCFNFSYLTNNKNLLVYRNSLICFAYNGLLAVFRGARNVRMHLFSLVM